MFYATGRVLAERNAGGLVGISTATRLNFGYSISEVSATARDASNLGAMIGRMEDQSLIGNAFYNSERVSERGTGFGGLYGSKQA